MRTDKRGAFEWTCLDRALAYLVEGIVRLVCFFPKDVIEVTGVILANVVCVWGGKNRMRIYKNTQLVYNLPEQSHFAKMFVRQIIGHQVHCFLETVKFILQPQSVRVIGLQDLESQIKEAEAQGLGHIIVTGHVGSWEMVAYYGNLVSQKPFHVLAKPSRFRGFTLFLERLRLKMGTPVLWNHKKNLVREILGALRRGESIGFVMDQKPEGRKGPLVSFFEMPTAFVGGPASIAIKTRCAIIGVFCLRESPFEYRILSRTLAPAGHQYQDEIELTQIMAREIEGIIKAYPEQWLWNYKRW